MSAAPLPQVRAVREGTSARGSGPVLETLEEPLLLFGLEFSLDTASLDELEAVTQSVTKEAVRAWFPRMDGTEEVVVLSTCHRVELLLLVRSGHVVDRWRELLPGRRDSWRAREGRATVDHLFRVAAGLESLARGEAEVRHQVRAAAGRVESRHPRPVLRELLVRASEAAEELAPSTLASPSIAAVAAARLCALVDRPFPRVLVIGSGTVGRQVTECLVARARVTVAYHRRPPEPSFLRATGARAVPLGRLSEELERTDAVVTAAKFGHRGILAVDVPQDRPIVLVDLGVPRNIDPRVRLHPNVRLVDLEELRTTSGEIATSDDSDPRLEKRAERAFEKLELRLREPWIDAFRRAAEDVRRSELESARPFLGALDPEQELAIDRLTQRLVARLLLPPTERIRALPAGPEGDLRRRLALELLRPSSRDP